MGLVVATCIFGFAPVSGASMNPARSFGPALYGYCVLEHFTGSLVTVAAFTMMMDVCRTRTAGSDYTFQASVVVVAQLGGRAVSGYTAEALGYAGNFLLSGGLSLFAAAVGALVLSNTTFRTRLLEGTGSTWERGVAG